MSPKKKAPKKKATPQRKKGHSAGLESRTEANNTDAKSVSSKSAAGNRRLLVLLPVLLLVCVATICLRYFNSSGVRAFAADARVFFLGPDEYYMNRGAYLQDERGFTVADTILLPEIPAAIDDGSLPSDGGYVGPEACADCHQEKHSTFVHTSHAKTSALPTRSTVLGKVASNPDGDIRAENILTTQSPNLRVEMIERDGQLIQRLVVDTPSETVDSEFPFDVVTGSGKIGQTYLYFENEHLYQLHASYLTSTDRWMNSPGYLDGAADYARPILSACLECHTTYAQPYAGSANQYHREHMVLGVTCEKCHGPGKEHVSFHQANPDSKSPHAIVNPASMSCRAFT